MENESMKMTLSIIHSEPLKYIVFTVCLIVVVVVLKKLFLDIIEPKSCPILD